MRRRWSSRPTRCSPWAKPCWSGRWRISHRSATNRRAVTCTRLHYVGRCANRRQSRAATLRRCSICCSTSSSRVRSRHRARDISRTSPVAACIRRRSRTLSPIPPIATPVCGWPRRRSSSLKRTCSTGCGSGWAFPRARQACSRPVAPVPPSTPSCARANRCSAPTFVQARSIRRRKGITASTRPRSWRGSRRIGCA